MPKMTYGVRQKRYWVYVHDVDGELLANLGETNSFTDAIRQAAAYIKLHEAGVDTVRIVDYTVNSGQTIWLAGPVNALNNAFGVGSRP